MRKPYPTPTVGLDVTSLVASNYGYDDDKSHRLLLDSRVVDVPMAFNPTFVLLSSLKPLSFNNLKKALRFLDNVGA
jgi:hypothetical protein